MWKSCSLRTVQDLGGNHDKPVIIWKERAERGVADSELATGTSTVEMDRGSISSTDSTENDSSESVNGCVADNGHADDNGHGTSTSELSSEELTSGKEAQSKAA